MSGSEDMTGVKPASAHAPSDAFLDAQGPEVMVGFEESPAEPPGGASRDD